MNDGPTNSPTDLSAGIFSRSHEPLQVCNAGWLESPCIKGGRSLIIPRTVTRVTCHSFLINQQQKNPLYMHTSNGIHTRFPDSLAIAVAALFLSFPNCVVRFIHLEKNHSHLANNRAAKGKRGCSVRLVASNLTPVLWYTMSQPVSRRKKKTLEFSGERRRQLTAPTRKPQM